ncbi:hypothetical protein VNO77_03025 [Canavalia gladiata]|uniref:Uncharacterized protein n=1 Tax=Canavalia gladiata TaxID=3824 RepID=A0AAN9MUP0_CANGL
MSISARFPSLLPTYLFFESPDTNHYLGEQRTNVDFCGLRGVGDIEEGLSPISTVRLEMVRLYVGLSMLPVNKRTSMMHSRH